MVGSPAGGWLDRHGNRDRNFVRTYSSALPVNLCFNLGFPGKVGKGICCASNI